MDDEVKMDPVEYLVRRAESRIDECASEAQACLDALFGTENRAKEADKKPRGILATMRQNERALDGLLADLQRIRVALSPEREATGR